MAVHQKDNSRELAILMISPQFPPLIGGYERAAERLSTVLAKQGVRVAVIAERRDTNWPKAEHINGYEIRRLPCFFRPHLHMCTSLLAYLQFLLLYGRNFDVWHVHQYGWHAALAIALGRVLRRPVVLKLTSSGSMGIDQSLGNGVISGLVKALHRKVDACLATSEETKTEALDFGIPEERIHLVPNGIEDTQFQPIAAGERAAIRRTLGVECEHLVLFVGRLSPEKNPVGLLEAWAAVNTKVRAGSLLVLVGDGEEKEKLFRKVQELNLVQAVRLVGMQCKVAAWYQAADIYVLPSFREGLSNTMVEALASGLPIISTRVSGSSVLTDPPPAGLTVNIGEVRALSEALESLLQDHLLRRQFEVNARGKFESYFCFSSIVPRLLSVYRSVLDEKR